MSSTASATQRFTIIKGAPKPGWHLLRMPQGSSIVADVPSELHEEEIVTQDDEEEERQHKGAQKSVNRIGPESSQKGRKRGRASRRWVLTTPVKTFKGPQSALDGTFMAMVMDPSGQSLHLVPLYSLVGLRQGLMGESTQDEAMLEEYMRTGSKLRAQTRIWSSKYGAALVGMLGTTGQDEDDDEGRARGGQGPRVWKRRFNPDDDDNDYILPTSHVALNYNDLLDLGRDGNEGGDVIDAVHQETDLGQDEIPDGAEDGYWAPEFGEDLRKDQGGMIFEAEEGPGFREDEGEDEGSEEDGDGTDDDEEEARMQAKGDVEVTAAAPQTHPGSRGGAATGGKGKAVVTKDPYSDESDFSQVEDDDDEDDDDEEA